MSAFLPLHDPNHPDREIYLRGAREIYQYNYSHVSPLAMLDRVPFKDEFSIGWLVKMAEKVAMVYANRADLEIHEEIKKIHHGIGYLMTHLVKEVGVAVRGLKRMVTDTLRFEPRVTAEPNPAATVDEYASLFRLIGLPPVSKHYKDDDAFAGMRVIGPNPVMLRRLVESDPRLPLTASDFAKLVPGDSFEAALAEGRLYLADYSGLDSAICGDYPHGQKYLYAPLALFVLNKATRRLAPVAIQCKPTPAADNPVFTPADGYNWLIAKTIVEIADGNYHETCTHLGQTHLIMEPFVVSTYRQLAPNHPVAVLLDPHFLGTLAINETAWRHLIANKGGVDKLCAASITSARGFAENAVKNMIVQDSYLPKTLAARGVADADLFPDYPYRDDSLLYWNAIQEWVRSYLGLYYTSDSELNSDNELQAWGRELASKEGGRVSGMPNDGAFHTLDELVGVVSFVLFTCSVQHAAVNFPQYDLMSYVPCMPLAGYRPAPTSKSGATEADYLAMLPPLDMAELQMELGYVLGSLHYTQLGEYNGQFKDARVEPLLTRFQQRLEEISRTIHEKNKTRRLYETLASKGIPQSINV